MLSNIAIAYKEHLSKDAQLRPIIATQEIIALKQREGVCMRLCASIMSQQLSTRVADVLYKRFLELYSGKEPTPEQITATPLETFRGLGLSYNKGRYVHNVAQFMVEHNVTDEMLYAMSNEDVINFLTQIKGVGQWTVEMLLMFTMGREDVFAVDDLGIQQTMTALYGLDATDKKKLKTQMLSISEQWIPYRTYACLYLWRSKDNK